MSGGTWVCGPRVGAGIWVLAGGTGVYGRHWVSGGVNLKGLEKATVFVLQREREREREGERNTTDL